MPNKNIYLDFLSKKLTDSGGNALLSSDKPRLLYQAFEKWEHLFLNGALSVDVSDAVAWAFSIDNDFAHTLIAGKSNGVLTGTVSAIAIKELANAPPTAGILHLTNQTSDTDSVLYSSWTLANSVYTFVVNATLAYVYAANDVCEIENTAPMVRVNNANIDSSQSADGIIIPQIDAETIVFLSKLAGAAELACYARLRGYNAQGKPIYNYRYDIIAENDIDPSNLNPPGPANKWYDASQIDALIRAGREFQFSINGSTSWHSTQADADRFYQERYPDGEWSAAIAMVLAPNVKLQYSVNGSTSWHDTYVDGDYYFHVSTDGGSTYADAVLFRHDGEDGEDAFVYTSYASSDAGAGWSLTPTNSLKYRAEIHSATALTPIESNFSAATWVKYIGDDGVSAFVYTSYASDSSGAGFSLTPSSSLRYRAEKHSATAIPSPIVTDFTGLFVLYLTGQFLSGAGVPGSGTGENGDQYLNTMNGDVFAKAGGAWTLTSNIKGPAFSVDEYGLLADLGDFDLEAAGFAYLATDTGNLYIKNSATSGDWSDPVPFKGDPGQALNPRGAWNDSTEYSIRDLVSYTNGNSYISLVNSNTNNLPTDATKWVLSAEKGATGATGATPDFISGTFENSDLTAGILTITHSQGNIILPLIIVDNTGKNVALDSAVVTFASNSITVDLSGLGALTGTWKYAFGGLPSVDGVDGINFVFHGAYDAGHTYAINDAVTDGGNIYASIQNANTDNAPATSPTYWLKVIEKGEHGDKGDPGVSGVSTRYVKGNISGAVAIDRDNGDFQVCTTTGTVTGITISNLDTETGMVLRINNAGGYAVTYNSVEIIATTDTGAYACSFYNDNGTIYFMGKGRMY